MRPSSWRRPRTVRGRIAGWVLLVVTTALSVNLLAVTVYLQHRDRDAVESELQHEATKFQRHLRAVPTNDSRTLSTLLREYVGEAVPESTELLFTVVDGVAEYRTRSEDGVRLDQNRAVLARVARATEPFTASIDTDDGPLVYAAIPVRAGDDSAQQGALVIVESTEHRHEGLLDTVRLLTLIGLLAVAGSGLLAWFVAGRVVAPLRRVTATAEAIDEERLSERIEVCPGTDAEVTDLAVTFNHMLDRIEGAFESQREFLDDAAHELRTPLTVLRGHLDVMGEDPVERAATHRMLVEEISGMDRIVGDLLLLAKAGRPDFLSRSVVDIDDLVVSVVARASSLGERRWRVEGTAETRLLADEQRLSQALLQLLVNAVAHTGPGDAITVTVRPAASTVELVVDDTGPGVPPEQRAHVFERFHQGPGSTGSGLGLAIVRSIVHAHGGSVGVGEAPSGGARFAITVPRHAVPNREGE